MNDRALHEEQQPAGSLGWHVMSGETFLAYLRRAHAGEDPELLYIEEYANARVDRIEGDE